MTGTNDNSSPLVYFIAGEASGDLLASRLMVALYKRTDGNIRFAGVGGETMQRLGFKSLYNNSELAVMGFAEVLPRIPKILKLMGDTIKDIKEKQPDIVITVDSWSFSERIHKRIKNLGITHIHYVAPQVWAWREDRAKKMNGKIDSLLTLLPFENKYFTKYGVDTTCVGHPVVEGFSVSGDGDEFRRKHNIPANATVLSVLPGSRHNEVNYLLPVFARAVKLLAKDIPDLYVVIPTVNAVSDVVARHSKHWDVPVILLCGKDKEKADAFAASSLALAASGTVSLELAISGVPHIIAYKMSPLTVYLAKKLLKIKYVNLINILANTAIIPELLQELCTPEVLADNLKFLMKNNDKAVQQIALARDQLKKLGYGEELTPSEKAADKVLDLIAKQKELKSLATAEVFS